MLDAEGLVAALAGAGVQFVVIGGFAVGAHGYVRATKDLDIVPAPDPGNLSALASVLRGIDARHHGLEGFAADEFPFDPRDPRQLAEGGNFVLDSRLGRLDIMQWIPGIPGDSAYQHLAATAIEGHLGGTAIKLCSRDDLIAMKRAAGREQDLVDLRHLTARD